MADKIDAILIDDDPSIHKMWDRFAEVGNGRYLGFYSSANFFSAAVAIDKTIPVYIDSNLKEEEPGEIIAKSIKALGFGTIYLQSSEPASECVSQMDWITAVIGKETPWDDALEFKWSSF